MMPPEDEFEPNLFYFYQFLPGLFSWRERPSSFTNHERFNRSPAVCWGEQPDQPDCCQGHHDGAPFPRKRSVKAELLF